MKVTSVQLVLLSRDPAHLVTNVMVLETLMLIRSSATLESIALVPPLPQQTSTFVNQVMSALSVLHSQSLVILVLSTLIRSRATNLLLASCVLPTVSVCREVSLLRTQTMQCAQQVTIAHQWVPPPSVVSQLQVVNKIAQWVTTAQVVTNSQLNVQLATTHGT